MGPLPSKTAVNPVFAPFGDLRRRNSEEIVEAVERGAVLPAFEPTSWTRLRFRLWS